MKKILSCLALLIAFTLATPLSARSFGFGVTGGMNVSKVDWKHLEDTKAESENGWFAGITFLFSSPIGIGLDAAVLYSQENVNLGLDTKMDSEIAKFISVPLHLRWDFKFPVISHAVVPFVMAGPQFNFALDDMKFDTKGTSLSTIADEFYSAKTNNWRLDLGAGVLLFDRLQVSYLFGIPMDETSGKDITIGDIEDNYKLGVHRVGLTYFF